MDELIEVEHAPVELEEGEIRGEMSGDISTKEANEELTEELTILILSRMGQLTSKDFSSDWVTEIVHAFCTQEVIMIYDQFISNPNHAQYRNVIGTPYGPHHLYPEGTTSPVRLKKGLVKILRKRPDEVESILLAYCSYHTFIVLFLNDIGKDRDYVKASDMRSIYREYRGDSAFHPILVMGFFKRFVSGSKFDYDERLHSTPCNIVTRKGMTDLRCGSNSLVSCGASEHSHVLIWLIFVAWWDIFDVTNQDVTGPFVVATLRKREDLRFNPLIAFRILRYRFTGK